MKTTFFLSFFIIAILVLGCTGLTDPIVGCWSQTLSIGDITNNLRFDSDGSFTLSSWAGTFRGTWKRTGDNIVEVKLYDEIMQKNIMTGEVHPTVYTYDPERKLLTSGNSNFVKVSCPN